MFDVLEHLSNDVEALHQLHPHFNTGGKLLLTVPAHMVLWSHFDEFSQHCRQYSADSLRATLKQAGYRVEYLTLFMFALFPAMWLSRRLSAGKRQTTAEGRTQQGVRELQINRVANMILGLADA